MTTKNPLQCSCGFIAKTGAGLATHGRACQRKSKATPAPAPAAPSQEFDCPYCDQRVTADHIESMVCVDTPSDEPLPVPDVTFDDDEDCKSEARAEESDAEESDQEESDDESAPAVQHFVEPISDPVPVTAPVAEVIALEAESEETGGAQDFACGPDVPPTQEAEIQTRETYILSAPEERAEFVGAQTVQLVGEFKEGQLKPGDQILDLRVDGPMLRWITPDGDCLRQELSKLTFIVPQNIAPLSASDNRAQKVPTRQVTSKDYDRLVEPIDLRGAQYLLLHNPRDARLTATKILHDYNIKPVAPRVVKVYYDIETAVFGRPGEIPDHSDRNAFITVIGMVIVLPDGTTFKRALLNDTLRYQLETVDEDISVTRFPSEAQAAQAFFRELNQLADDHGALVLCIGHNASCNPRGEPYDLPWLTSRSLFNLNIVRKTYRDQYSATEGVVFHGIGQFPRLFFLDTIRATGAYLTMEKAKLPSLALDALAQHFGLPGKSGDMSYVQLAQLSTQFGAEFGRAVSYCVQDCVVVSHLDAKLNLSDTRIAFVTKCQIPFGMAINLTTAQCLSALIQTEFRARGYAIPYNICQVETEPFKGAFTAVDGEVDPDALALQVDFASQYPSSIQALCISPETIRPSSSSITKQLLITDEGDQPLSYHYEQSTDAVLPSLVASWKADRLRGKAEANRLKAAAKAETDPLTKDQLTRQAKHATLQDALAKACLNTLYGLTGARSFPLFDRRVAQSVTAYARQTIVLTRKIIVDQLGGKLLASDTDSVSYQLSDQITTPAQVLEQVQLINAAVAAELKNDYMKVAIEEVLVPPQPGHRCYVNFSRKSYMFFYANLSGAGFVFADGAQWTGRGCYGNAILKQRGFVTGAFTKPVQERLQRALNSLCDPAVDGLDLVNKIYELEFDRLHAAISKHDTAVIGEYVKRVKTGGASPLAQYLTNTFGLTENYVDILHTKGLKRSTSAIPIQFLTVQNARLIDVAHHALQISSAMLKVVKLRLSEEQLKLVPKKVSATKQQILDLADDLDEDDILVRQETSAAKTRKYQFFRVPFHAFKPSRENAAYHEIITCDTIRFFADIDKSSLELFHRFLTTTSELFQSAFNFPVQLRYLHNPASNGYHVFTNASCSLEMARFLGDRINALMGLPDYVDLAPYGLYKSLRLPGCPKVGLDGTVNANSRYVLPDGQKIYDFLITNTIGCTALEAPLHISQKLPVDPIYQFGLARATDAHMEALRVYVRDNLKCPDAVLRAEDNRIMISFGAVRPICPYHKRSHDNENMWARVVNQKDGQGVAIHCFREMQGEVKWAERVIVQVDRAPRSILEDIQIEIEDLRQPVLSDSITCNQRYVEIAPIARDAKTVFLRSQLGTGKTEAVLRLIKEKRYRRVLYLSFRKTFSQALAARFASVGDVMLYSDLRGALYHAQPDGTHKDMIVCQVEALARYQDTPDLLVVDEWESLLSQMNSAYALTTSDVVDALRRVWRAADQCIVMDGFLQQTSIDLFNRLVGNDRAIIQQNLAQPFDDHTATVTISSRHNDNIKTIFGRIRDAFQSGGKACAFITSNSQSESLELLLLQQCPGIRVKRYHGDQTKLDDNGRFHADNKRADMLNLREVVDQCDVLIYTSTITAGISIDHAPFAYVCACLHENTCDPLAFVQGIHRVRRVTSKHVDVFVNRNFHQAHYQTPRAVAPPGYDVVLTRSLKEQLLVWLTARDACLNACQQWVVPALLKQMGYRLSVVDPDADPRPAPKTEEAKQLTQALRTVKQHARHADYCDFTEGISDECLRVHDALKNRGAATDEATATRLANQMRCLHAGLHAGLNPTETNDLPKKIDAIRALTANGMLLSQDDDNQLIANYLSAFADQIRFRKQVAKIAAMGIEPSTQAFEDALKRDVQDRAAMGVANKTINVADLNKQLIAVRAAAKIDVANLPIDQEFNATDHFAELVADLKDQKVRNHFELIQQALAIMGFASKTRDTTKTVDGKKIRCCIFKTTRMP